MLVTRMIGMSLAHQDIDKLCELARLEIGADEIGDVAHKLSDIVDMVSRLSAVPTDGVEPMAHPLHRPQRLRDDVVTGTDRRERSQRIAPAVERGLYVGPKVVEGPGRRTGSRKDGKGPAPPLSEQDVVCPPVRTDPFRTPGALPSAFSARRNRNGM